MDRTHEDPLGFPRDHPRDGPRDGARCLGHADRYANGQRRASRRGSRAVPGRSRDARAIRDAAAPDRCPARKQPHGIARQLPPVRIEAGLRQDRHLFDGTYAPGGGGRVRRGRDRRVFRAGGQPSGQDPFPECHALCGRPGQRPADGYPLRCRAHLLYGLQLWRRVGDRRHLLEKGRRFARSLRSKPAARSSRQPGVCASRCSSCWAIAATTRPSPACT